MPGPEQRPSEQIGKHEFKYSSSVRQKVASAFKDKEGNISERGVNALTLLDHVEWELATPESLYNDNVVGLTISARKSVNFEDLISSTTDYGLLPIHILKPTGIIGDIPKEDVPEFAIKAFTDEKIEMVEVDWTMMPNF